MSDSIRLLSYNVQCRSWGMEALADTSWLDPTTTAETRAEAIADNILASAHDYDIVCLNEVFDEDARDIFVSRLSGRFPYAITKADYLNLEVMWAGMQLVPINPAALALTVTGVAFLAGWAELGAPKVEDSGVMIFSKWMFETRPLTDTIIGLLNPLAVTQLTPIGLPVVDFLPFEDSTANDKWAAKGLVHARFLRDGRTVDVFATHTQADEHKVSEEKDTRLKQFTAIEQRVKEAMADRADDDFYILAGDLNIPGGQELLPVTDDTAEWDEVFRGAGPAAGRLLDTWGREQCLGAPELRDPGTTASVDYAPPRQRLDYALRNPSSPIAAQHVYVDHLLETAPPGLDGVASKLSDHSPLGVDLFPIHPDNAPQRARPLDPAPDDSHDDGLFDALVRWYRVKREGTYAIKLWSNQEVTYEVYLDTDLSTPWPQYRTESHPDFGEKFVLPEPPFLIKVFMPRRGFEAFYHLRVRRYEGQARWEAMQLVPGIAQHHGFPPPGTLLNLQDDAVPWKTQDAIWFRFDAPQVTLADIPMSVTVRTKGAGVLAVGTEGGGAPTLIDEVGFDDGEATLSWTARPGDQHYVTVRREDVNRPLDFEIEGTIPVTLFVGGSAGAPEIVCVEETSGWGSDDIALSFSADGTVVRDIGNDEVGDMDGADDRGLATFLTDDVAYSDRLGITVIEEDWPDPDDRGSRDIPTLPDGPLSVGQELAPGVTVTEALTAFRFGVTASVDVDDGRYEFRHRLARWNN
ncbi:MAG: endonuclease/exonuclease/phosphatase family protein [Micropruina sp.]|uniref:endonuclease/exonuclease/phosphatase family protein n=1 Tax=Micropruina sp. TaxID=2737536 RepID=UPI0039E2F9FC